MVNVNITNFLKDTAKSWDRVIKLSRKPRSDEFKNVAKITGLGMLLVGFLGFMIRMIIQGLGSIF